MSIVYALVYVTVRIISKLVFRIKTEGQEHFPRKGGFIMASNHISYYDPPLIGSWAPRVVYFMAKKELFANRLFGAILHSTNALPLDRIGFDRQAIKTSLEKISDGFGLTLFPEGTRSKTGTFRKPKAGIGMLASMAGCQIIPAYIEGPNRLKDCFLGRIRLRIIFGEPIDAEWVTSRPEGKAGYQEIADEVMNRIKHLRTRTEQIK